jgi:hypothetical protein
MTTHPVIAIGRRRSVSCSDDELSTTHGLPAKTREPWVVSLNGIWRCRDTASRGEASGSSARRESRAGPFSLNLGRLRSCAQITDRKVVFRFAKKTYFRGAKGDNWFRAAPYYQSAQFSRFSPGICRKWRRFRVMRVARCARVMLAIRRSARPIRFKFLICRSRSNWAVDWASKDMISSAWS